MTNGQDILSRAIMEEDNNLKDKVATMVVMDDQMEWLGLTVIILPIIMEVMAMDIPRTDLDILEQHQNHNSTVVFTPHLEASNIHTKLWRLHPVVECQETLQDTQPIPAAWIVK